MADGSPVLPRAAIAFLEAKGLKPSRHCPPSVVQARMAERFPAAGGIVVVDQTKPKEWPRFDKDGLEIVY